MRCSQTALEALKEKLSEKNTTDRSVRRPPAGSTSSPSASVQSTRFQALQTKLAAKSNRTAGAGNATSETKEQAPKIDMAEFPFGIPQFFATFTAKGPKLSDSIKQVSASLVRAVRFARICFSSSLLSKVTQSCLLACLARAGVGSYGQVKDRRSQEAVLE